METVYKKTPGRAGRSPARSNRRRPIALLAALALAAAVALALAGCGGGSSSSGVAATGSTTASTAPASGGSATPAADTTRAEQFSQCMRSHGVPNFPDPTNGKLSLRVGGSSGINPNSPQFQSAQRACRSLAPNQSASPGQSSQLQAQALKFAQCMRSHGVPNYPDPSVSGGTVRFTAPSGAFNAQSPQFKSAQQACRSDAPGGTVGAG